MRADGAVDAPSLSDAASTALANAASSSIRAAKRLSGRISGRVVASMSGQGQRAEILPAVVEQDDVQREQEQLLRGQQVRATACEAQAGPDARGRPLCRWRRLALALTLALRNVSGSCVPPSPCLTLCTANWQTMLLAMVLVVTVALGHYTWQLSTQLTELQVMLSSISVRVVRMAARAATARPWLTRAPAAVPSSPIPLS